jgi:phosphomannomutase/phosphoglucomutase
MINQSIFREYDIRGLVARDLTSEFVDRLGAAYARYMAPNGERLKVCVGGDVRPSTPSIKERLTAALLRAGLDVIDIGIVSTPVFYYSTFTLPVDGGIMITASHNPSEFNGFKINRGRSSIFGVAIQDLYHLMEDDIPAAAVTPGVMSQHDILEDYRLMLEERFPPLPRKLKIVADAGNGCAALTAPSILRHMGCDLVELYCDADGTFPNHHPDPTEEKNLQDLIKAVRTEGADVGLAFDGDADRIGVVDRDGRVVWGDQLMILFAGEILKRRPGETFIGEVKCSQVMYDAIREMGGNAVMWRTGHSLIKSKMKETGAVLAGEMSGHMFFADGYYGYDDAVYAACRLLAILASLPAGAGLHTLIDELPATFTTPEIRRDCPDEKKFDVIASLRRRIEDSPGEATEVITIDGVRVIYPYGWGLARASNTQPVLVLRFEADSQENLDRVRARIEGELSALGF